MDRKLTALRATAHPLRLRILSLLTGADLSAAEVARILGLTHANASYHLRALLAAGVVVTAGEARIRGGTAKLYRYPLDWTPDVAPPSLDDTVEYARAVAVELERRLALRSDAPGESHASDLEGWVAPAVWDQARGLLQEAMRLLHLHNQAPHSPDAVHVSATTWAFRMEP